jgi:hypothetical protein
VFRGELGLSTLRRRSTHTVQLILVQNEHWSLGERNVRPAQNRRNFALGSCDYVDTKLKEQAESLQMDPDIIMTAIVSFSFVNADL